MTLRGISVEHLLASHESLRTARAGAGYVLYSHQAMRALHLGRHREAASWLERANSGDTREGIRARRLAGCAALGLGDFGKANDLLHSAIARAREVGLVEEEIPALIAQAEVRWRDGALEGARELLEDAWEAAERGPYPLCHADALNLLAEIELQEGNRDAAAQAATQAYRLAWCDGPPYAYHWSLEAAKKSLAKLGVPQPTDLKPFEESKFEPMPDFKNPDNSG